MEIEHAGELVQLEPTDYRTISALVFAGGSTADGLGSGLNDNGLLTFYASFTDGSAGIFTSDAVAMAIVPEPQSLVLALLGLVCICRGPFTHPASNVPSRIDRRFVGVLATEFGWGIANAAAPVGTIAPELAPRPPMYQRASCMRAFPLPATSAPIPPPITPTINAQGEVVFYGLLSGIGTTSANNIGIWSGTPGNVNVTALANDSALGIGAGVNYQGFVPTFSPLAGGPFPVPVNAGNQVAYDAFVMGINVNTSNDEGIWSGSRLGPTAAVREGDASAPNPPGSIYTAISGVTFNPPYINDAGQIAFTGSLSFRKLSESGPVRPAPCNSSPSRDNRLPE